MTDLQASVGRNITVSLVTPTGWKAQHFWAGRKRVFGVVLAFSPTVLAIGVERFPDPDTHGLAVMIGPLWFGLAVRKHLEGGL